MDEKWYLILCFENQGVLRRGFARVSKHSLFLFNRSTGQKKASKCQNYSRLKIFLKKFFVEYIILKNTKKKQKYSMETMDDFLAKTLSLCGFGGVDKVILGCYNEVAPRKIGAYNWIKKDVGYKAVVALIGKQRTTPPRPQTSERAIKRMCRTEIATTFFRFAMTHDWYDDTSTWQLIGIWDVDGQGWNWSPICYIWFSRSHGTIQEIDVARNQTSFV